jgi:MFS family permease
VRAWKPEHREAHWLGPLRSRGLVFLLTSFVGVGMALGMLNVLLVSYAERHHVAGGAATLLALNAFGSLLGALVYGAVKWKSPAPRRLLGLRCGLAVSYAALCLVPSPPLMIVLMLATGCFLAPALTVTFVLVGELAPAGTVTEAFAWLITLFTTGAAAGSAVTGFALDHAGMGTAAATAVVGLVGGTLVQVAGRRSLAPAGDPEPAVALA